MPFPRRRCLPKATSGSGRADAFAAPDPLSRSAGKFLPDGKQIASLPNDFIETTWRLNGRFHRDPENGPAVQIVDALTGNPVRDEYYLHGKLHRTRGPAYVGYREDGSFSLSVWCRDGMHHRDPKEGPASISNSRDGERVEEYFVAGRYHRNPASGPAYIKRNAAGEIVLQLYWVNGQVHRDAANGPARIDIKGGLEEHEYYRHGEKHREGGPAVIHRDRATGEILKAEYWLDGEQLDTPLGEEGPC